MLLNVEWEVPPPHRNGQELIKLLEDTSHKMISVSFLLLYFCVCGLYFSFCNLDVCYIIKNGCCSVLIYIYVKEYSLYIYFDEV